MAFTITARGAFYLKAFYLTGFPLQELSLSDFLKLALCREATV